jgi:hypothetical protein
MTQVLPKTMAAALSSMFVETVEEKASRLETAIAMAISSTHSATVAVIARQTLIAMAFAMT